MYKRKDHSYRTWFYGSSQVSTRTRHIGVEFFVSNAFAARGVSGDMPPNTIRRHNDLAKRVVECATSCWNLRCANNTEEIFCLKAGAANKSAVDIFNA